MMSENSTGPAECLSLHVGSSGFLTAWRPGATQSYDMVAQASKGKEAETASPCKNLGPDLSHSPGEKSPKAAQIEVTRRSWQSKNQEEGPHRELNQTGPLISAFQPLEL